METNQKDKNIKKYVWEAYDESKKYLCRNEDFMVTIDLHKSFSQTEHYSKSSEMLNIICSKMYNQWLLII